VTHRGRRRTPIDFRTGATGDLAVWRDGVGLAVIPALFGLWPLVTVHFVI
jgi:hypothetical protein